MELNQAIELTDKLQKKLCRYVGSRCDCKYLDSPCKSTERTGCCEARELKAFLESLLPVSPSGGAYLIAVRKKCGLTLRAVEAKTGISNATISQMETGKISNPSMHNMWALSELYGVDFKEFCEHFMGKESEGEVS